MRKLITKFYLSETFIKIGLFIALFIATLLILIIVEVIEHPEKISLGGW